MMFKNRMYFLDQFDVGISRLIYFELTQDQNQTYNFNSASSMFLLFYLIKITI